MAETQNPDAAAEAAASDGSVAQQVATLKTCDAILQQLASHLQGLAACRESAPGAMRVRQAVDALCRGLVYEFPVLSAEQALDELLAADGWTHPTQALETPIRDWELLLQVCDERLGAATGAERTRLDKVRGKLERALRLAEEAERTRYRRRLAELKRRPGAAAAEETHP